MPASWNQSARCVGAGEEAAILDGLAVGARRRRTGHAGGGGGVGLEVLDDAVEPAALEVIGGRDVELVLAVGAEDQARHAVGRRLRRLEVEVGIGFVLKAAIAAGERDLAERVDEVDAGERGARAEVARAEGRDLELPGVVVVTDERRRGGSGRGGCALRRRR